MGELFLREKTAIKAVGVEPTAEMMKKINQHTLRELSADEVYIFRATLCDNEIDRDTEAFTAKSLRQLAKLFVGKTVISDHHARAENQMARVFAAEVVSMAEKTTKYGEQYQKLDALCYMLRNGDNQSTIDKLDAGILKEMSIGCKVAESNCSICGQSYWSPECSHRRGEIYERKTCFVWLNDARDAYEVSFVAVPAQTGAGVHKQAEQDAAVRFAAEIAEMTDTLKAVCAQLRELTSAKAKEPGAASPANEGNNLDPEGEELIKSATALIQKLKGEPQ